MTDEERRFLKWIYDRMSKVHKEKENLDYMIKLKSMTKVISPEIPDLSVCPDCNNKSVEAQNRGGVECLNPACHYWFCY